MLDELELQHWRETTRLRLYETAKALRSDLSAQIDRKVGDLGKLGAFRPGAFFKSDLTPFLNRELGTAFAAELRQIEAEAEALPWIDTDKGNLGMGLEAVLSGAGTALSLAPLAAVPFLTAALTITTTSFFVVTTSAVSIPLAIGAIGGAAVLTFSGSKLADTQIEKARGRIGQRAQQELENALFGAPKAAAPQGFLPLLLARVDQQVTGKWGQHA